MVFPRLLFINPLSFFGLPKVYTGVITPGIIVGLPTYAAAGLSFSVIDASRKVVGRG